MTEFGLDYDQFALVTNAPLLRNDQRKRQITADYRKDDAVICSCG